jgi:hypothetical protein|tara:strand:- start:1021 stop:1329 length:309 start_codon:yes stop_codon:yes gene_type:complete
MKKFSVIFLIIFLILCTALIKNSTKKLDEEIFVKKENIRSLKNEYENIKLEYDYLSSTEKLFEFQRLYFDNELMEKDIQEIKIIKQKFNRLKFEQLRFVNEQ